MSSTSSAKTKAANDQNPSTEMPDPVELANVLYKVTERCQKIVSDYLNHYGANAHKDFSTFQEEGIGMADPANIGDAFMELGQKMMEDPMKIWESQMDLMTNYSELWQSTMKKMMGDAQDPMIAPERGDRRFKHEAWEDNPWFDFIKQAYLLWAQKTVQSVNDVKGINKKTSQKIDFYTRQYVDALSPSNFLMTNPEVLQETLESKGKNLMNGLNNLLEDFEKGEGKLAIKMADENAFEVGKNIAITPGQVVFQNDFMQLIQYEPTTKKVHKTPLLITPPWINKYYILDLRPENSFVKWAVDQGYTVFMTSWVNPDETYKNKSMEDYMVEGQIAALDAIEQATGEKEVNVIGYCIGGTLLACLLAWMEEKKDKRIKSATFFTTLLDFSDPGELGVFIDDEQLTALERRMDDKGYLEGHEMATSFNLLRSNDLIWSFVINNYLLGKDPFPFDLLYWNSDSTRLPAAMHSFYLRNMYQKNKLVKSGGIEMNGVKIDLTTIKTPSFFISTREDHIAPWKATYKGAQKFSGPVKFVLAASGHIAGVVNPPAKGKYSHWLNSAKITGKAADEWVKSSKELAGSWWPEWDKWMQQYSGGSVTARKPGSGKLPALEKAPGSYVLKKS